MSRKVPIRKCVACGERKNKFELLRIVNNNDQIMVDSGGKLPGRGAYICPEEKCLDKAKKSNKLGRALKTSISDEIYKQIMEEIGNE